MVAIKAAQAETFLKKPDPSICAVLLYGTDAGLVAERSAVLAKLIAKRESPEGEVLRIDDADLDGDPGRLSVELETVPMFGGRKIIRATTGRRLNTLLLKPLIQDATFPGFLIVEAGNLRPDDALRALFDKSAKGAAGVPCYPDEGRDIEGLIRDTLNAAKIAIGPEARELLASRLGADRALTRRELEKLVLYAKDSAEITIDDVDAVIGDAAELALDKIPEAAASGDGKRALRDCGRALASGDGGQAIIAATQRYFLRLHRIRADIARGRSFDDAIRQLRPQPHFKSRDALAGQCRTWSADRLQSALSDIHEAAKAARVAGPLEQVVAERLLLKLARLGRPTAQQ